MTEKQTVALLRLLRIKGIGSTNTRKLVDYFGSPEAVFSESLESLMEIPGFGLVTAQSILNEKFRKDAEDEWNGLIKGGIQCISCWDPGYPELLKQCEDAPVLLFKKGCVSLAGQRFVSIVGTRNMSEHGRRICEGLVEDLAPYSPVIVSGLAYGIDICAQLAAMRNGLLTVACLAHGLDSVYPKEHRRYIEDIEAQGALLSEFSLGTSPEPMHFVRRNRIIAGLSEATIVVESASEGGSLITADLAFGYHREVFAIPGRSTDRFSAGCNALIRDQKAHLMQSVSDLARVMDWSEEQTPGVKDGKLSVKYLEMGKEERCIAEFLIKNKKASSLDDIAIGCRYSVKQTASLLFQLEMKGLIRPLPGKRYRIGGK
ncbi:MAG: DNA-processing protein DprA [Robiginitalea sp.]